jgi:uncharacterized membrane protein YqjE
MTAPRPDLGPYPIEDRDATLGELVGQLSDQVGALVRSHVHLAKEEMTAEVKKAGVGAGLMGGSAIAGWLALLLASFALAWLLADLIDSAPLGFVIVALVWAAAAAWLFFKGRRELEEASLAPEETIEELKEDRRWLSEQKS